MKNTRIALLLAAVSLSGSSWAIDVPQDRVREIAQQLSPMGWTVDTHEMGQFTIYTMEHRDGTVWQSNFGHKLERQAYRLLHPEWIPLENNDIDCLLLEKHASLAASGWHAVYQLQQGTTQFPDLSFQLRSKDGKLRTTQSLSEFSYWLKNGAESCWGADRPYPNCEIK